MKLLKAFLLSLPFYLIWPLAIHTTVIHLITSGIRPSCPRLPYRLLVRVQLHNAQIVPERLLRLYFFYNERALERVVIPQVLLLLERSQVLP